MALWIEPPILEGKSVRLSPIREDQSSLLWEAAAYKEIWEFTASKIFSLEEMKADTRKAADLVKEGKQLAFSVGLKESGRLVGSTRYLDILPENKTLEIGSTWYTPEVWRTSVNTECKFLLLRHAFEIWDMNRVQLKTDSRNIRSQEAIERLGAVKEGILRKDRIIADGYARNTVYYSILKEEWPQVKERLIQKLNIIYPI
ncbi:GNAT family N-acetyltransferase [Bacillus infantis]|uniref:GNAT family N-acetyltransferase n=1 Tax=Bacillus infantis TaxID=324767 RepID=UPI0021554862|nr:GNAT family protein [Bacillus infantis]MCR6610948.1 GNAT family N-acetyltransferase [Bacillus infantis]